MATEYAVQRRTLIDGAFDRTMTREHDRAPKFTRETAQAEADSWNRRPDGNVIARVVTREVTDWVEIPQK